MFKRSCVLLAIFVLIVVIGCGAAGTKPGTGGSSSATAIERSEHPQIPEGVTCYVCHKEERPTQEFHKDFPNDCSQCHGTRMWMAYKFPHTQWALNKVHNQRCNRCHQNMETFDFKAYQCWGCHHEVESTTKLHKDLGIDDITACADCHKGFTAE